MHLNKKIKNFNYFFKNIFYADWSVDPPANRYAVWARKISLQILCGVGLTRIAKPNKNNLISIKKKI